MISRNISWKSLSPQRWFSNDEAQPFLVATSSSPHGLDSVDRPCGDVSVTGSASRAARKAHCAAQEVVIHAYLIQYKYKYKYKHKYKCKFKHLSVTGSASRAAQKAH